MSVDFYWGNEANAGYLSCAKSCICTNPAYCSLTTFKDQCIVMCQSWAQINTAPSFPNYLLVSNPASCHHSTLMPLSLVWIIMHPVACSNINHLPNERHPKNAKFILWYGPFEIIKTIPLDPKYNKPRFYSLSVTAKISTLWPKVSTKLKKQIINKHLTFLSFISDSERENDALPPLMPATLPTIDGHFIFIRCSDAKEWSYFTAIIIKQLPEPYDGAIAIVDNPYAELLCWHYQLNHLSFRVLKTLATSGFLTRRLVSAKEQKHAACIFGAMH